MRAGVWAKEVQEVKRHKLLVINKSWRYKAQHGDYSQYRVVYFKVVKRVDLKNFYCKKKKRIYFLIISLFIVPYSCLKSLQCSFLPICSPGMVCSSVSKESTCSAGDPSLIPGLGRSPGEENDNPLQYSCLENSMDRGGW